MQRWRVLGRWVQPLAIPVDLTPLTPGGQTTATNRTVPPSLLSPKNRARFPPEIRRKTTAAQPLEPTWAAYLLQLGAGALECRHHRQRAEAVRCNVYGRLSGRHITRDDCAGYNRRKRVRIEVGFDLVYT